MELDSGKRPLFKPQEEEEQENSGYSILSEYQVQQRQEEDIARVSGAISEPRATAIVLLLRFNWNLTKLLDHWFEDEARVRSTLGLFAPSPPPSGPITCGICFETTTAHSRVSCGHPFCNPCWSKYIDQSITNDAAGCLLLTCPHPLCPAAVGQDMVESLASTLSHKEKFSKFLLRSYLQDSYFRHRVKWCPGPDCDRAVDFSDFSGRGQSCDVECRCSHSFCWNCGGEAHRPVGCAAAADWLARSVDESETATWLAVHTKACPSCKRPIERSQGCDLMRCPMPCGHTFCWTCLESLPSGSSHHECSNKKKKKHLHAAGPTRESVNKYQHWYEQWVGCLKSRRKAMEELQEVKRRVGSNRFGGVVVGAWDQMIRCRRVLQWGYAYAFYFPDGQVEKRRFLDYLLCQAESSLERLHQCGEEELEAFLSGPAHYCTKLSDLSFVTANYFQNLVRALEEGMMPH